MIISVSESYTRNASGKLAQRVMGACSQFHAENTAELVMRTNLTINAPECISSGGISNYGYSFTASRNMVINEQEAPAVKMMFEMTANQASYSNIIEKLDKSGYKTRSGKTFPQTSILSILRNPKYKGTYFYNSKDRRKKNERVLVGTFDEVRIENGIPRIVTDELFERVQTVLDNRQMAGSQGPNKDSNYVLTGITFCAHCGSPIHGRAKVAGRAHKRYCHYVCSNVDNPKNNIKCTLKPILQDKLEHIVAKALSDLVHEIIAKNNIIKQFKSRISEALLTDIENYKRSNNFIEIHKNKLVNAFANTTDEDLLKSLQEKFKNDNLKIEDNNNAIKATQKKLTLLTKDIASFEAKVNAITADDIFNNKCLFKSFARRFIKRIEVGGDIMIEFYDL